MTLVHNKKAHHDFALEKKYLAGAVLQGQEVKSLRLKQGSLRGSYLKLIGGELYLINAQINPYSFADTRNYDPKRTRKLLLKKKELEQLQNQLEQKKRTLVPLRWLLQGKLIKLEFAVGKGLKSYEKRAKLKERDQKRSIERELKQRYS